VKTPTCNLRVEIPSRFRQLENQKYLRPPLGEDDRENNSAHSWLVHVFTQPGSNCDKQACRWRVRSSLNIRHSLTSISKLLPFAAPCAPAPFVRAAIGETQQAAWVAICELANALKEEGFAGPTLWKAALSATESWIELLI
jgi:hypothetical protein